MKVSLVRVRGTLSETRTMENALKVHRRPSSKRTLLLNSEVLLMPSVELDEPNITQSHRPRVKHGFIEAM